ncbi:TatD family deoxyribonuclease [candidate division KSB1 bacterium]|nr:MAG: TatD family deoxyribonuclease [candidate division KSB1 bacterium]
MIDTHSHLYYSDFDHDLNEVIVRAQAAGVNKIITAAVDRATAEQCLDIAARFPGIVFAAIGVHPSEVSKTSEDDLLWMEAMAGDPNVIAIGEIGLDIYRGETNLAEQEVVFRRMLELAKQTDLPVIVHHRAAGMRTIEIVEESGIKRGVFHCFSEDLAYALRVLATGLCVSFTGNITYKNSRLPDIARALPLEKILLETDSPFMAPAPIRGKRCEPMHVRDVVLKLAEIHGRTLDEADRITTSAAERTFFANRPAFSL